MRTAAIRVGLGLMLVLSAPGDVATASNHPKGNLSISRTAGVLFAALDFTTTKPSDLTIDFLRLKGGRFRLFQRCIFVRSASGTYLCSLDVGPGSPARRSRSEWIVRARSLGRTLDESQLAHHSRL